MAATLWRAPFLVSARTSRDQGARGEKELILRAQRYEAEALADLFETHFDAVHRYLYTFLGEAEASEELTRRVLLRALEGLPRFRRFESGFSVWLYRVANLVLSEAGRPGVGGLPAPGGSEGEVRLRQALRTLTSDQLDVLGLRFIAGLSAAEVARATGRGLGRVQALQHRALLALRRAAAAESEEPQATAALP
jgi:RNA polymerase sigma-70 factor (ECF subfamily)